MKPKFRIFHLPLFISALLGIALIAYSYLSTPRDSIHTYALTLEENSFICGDGYTYVLSVPLPDGRLSLTRSPDSRHKEFVLDFIVSASQTTLPYKLAFSALSPEQVFIPNDGSVWRLDEKEKDNFIITPYAVPADDTEAERKLPSESKSTVTSDREHYHLGISFYFESEKELGSVTCRLAVKFKDGWYYMGSDECELERSPQLMAVNTLHYSVNAGFTPLYLDDYMDLYLCLVAFDASGNKLFTSNNFAGKTSGGFLKVDMPSDFYN